jgi:hypothetical protein
VFCVRRRLCFAPGGDCVLRPGSEYVLRRAATVFCVRRRLGDECVLRQAATVFCARGSECVLRQAATVFCAGAATVFCAQATSVFCGQAATVFCVSRVDDCLRQRERLPCVQAQRACACVLALNAVREIEPVPCVAVASKRSRGFEPVMNLHVYDVRDNSRISRLDTEHQGGTFCVEPAN